jgi:hypothetical protein
VLIVLIHSSFLYGTKRREAWIRTIHTKQWYKKKRGRDKNNSHKTMEQKEERRIRKIHTKKRKKKKRN